MSISLRYSSSRRELELVVARPAYDAAARQLLHNHRTWAIGAIRWRETDLSQEMLVDDLTVVDQASAAAALQNSDSYFMLSFVPPASDNTATAPRASSADLVERLQQLTPCPSKHAVGLVIYRGSPPHWNGGYLTPWGEFQPLGRVRVTGADPITLEPDSRSSSADLPASSQAGEAGDEEAAWSRTRGAMGDRLFRRLRSTRVTMIGAGRTGTLCAQQLAALGCAQIRLVDADLIEPHNVLGTVGLAATDQGKNKVDALARLLLAMRPDLLVNCFSGSVLDAHVQRALFQRPSDLVVSAVDNHAARLVAWLIAQSTLAPHLDIATAILRLDIAAELARGDERVAPSVERQILADIRLFSPGRGQGCPVCVGGIEPLVETLYQVNAPDGALQRGGPQAWNDERAGSLVTWNSVVVGAGLQLWLDYLAGRRRNSTWQRLRWAAAEGLLSSSSPVMAGAGCNFCNE